MSGFHMLSWCVATGLLWLAWSPGGVGGQEQPEEAGKRLADGDVVVRRDADKNLLYVQIPAHDGSVAWSDVLQAVMRAGHLNDQAMQDKMPSGSLDLRASYSGFAIAGVNLLLGPDIRMQIVTGDRQQPDHLLVTVDEGAVQAKKRKLAKGIRDRLPGREGNATRPAGFGLHMPDKWQESEPKQLLVIVLHGFNSSPQRFEPLATALRSKIGFESGTYSYPDDQPIQDSAVQLSSDLKEIATSQPKRRIALVAHSMGGLVARAMLENPELDSGNVVRLIMVAPPNQGSLFARVGYGLDLLDHAAAEAEREEVSRFYAAIEDGMSEATEDLKPDSVFLRELNARQRNAEVEYTILLGTGGRFTRQQIEQLRERLATAKSKSAVVGLFAPRIDETLADLDEVVQGVGDGAVAVKRGKLAGVDDVHLLKFTHLGVLQNAPLENDPVFKLVLAKLVQAKLRADARN